MFHGSCLASSPSASDLVEYLTLQPAIFSLSGLKGTTNFKSITSKDESICTLLTIQTDTSKEQAVIVDAPGVKCRAVNDQNG